MLTPIVTLMFAGAVAAQSPSPAPKPVPKPAPRIEFDRELEEEIQEAIERGMEEAEEAAERAADEAIEQAGHMAERALKAAERQLAELAWQFPVPRVPPVPASDPREAQREAERAKQPRRRQPENWVEATDQYTRSFKVGRNATLMLGNLSGTIQVAPGGNDAIEIQAMKHAWGPNLEQAKQRLADGVIEAYATANRVEVRVEHGGRRDGRGMDIEFDVKVPADASVELRTVSGDIRVTNVKGEVRVHGVSGNLGLEGTPRLALVKTVSGDITLNNAGADANLSVSTVNGDLLVQTLAARSLDLNTVNGDVRIAGWSGDRAQIRTLDGDLDLQPSFTKGGRYEIESHSGDIVLSLPEAPGFEVDAQTFSGRIRIDFPVKSEGPIRDGDRGPRSVRGTYGDGSSVLRVQTFSGDLTIVRR